MTTLTSKRQALYAETKRLTRLFDAAYDANNEEAMGNIACRQMVVDEAIEAMEIAARELLHARTPRQHIAAYSRMEQAARIAA